MPNDLLSETNLAAQIAEVLILAITLFYIARQVRQAARQVQGMQEQVQEMRTDRKTLIEMEKRKKLLEFITRFNDEQMVRLRGRAATALRQGTWKEENHRVVTGDDPARSAGKEREQGNNYPAYHSILTYLNFFEEIALAVCNGLANKEICRRFFARPLIHLMNNSQEICRQSPGMYMYLNELGRRWQEPLPLILDHPIE
jgi:hypothetical protein